MAGELTSISLAMGMGVVDGNVQPVLGNLSVSPSSATVGTVYNGAVSGKTAGSTLTLSGAGAAGLSISGSVITGTPTASGAVDVIETLAGATGSPKTNSGVVTVAAAGPQAVVMPTPSFGSTNLLAWWDVNKTFTDSDGSTQPLAYYDDIAFNTVTTIEDASGNGFALAQADKSLQPLKGGNGGAVTDIAAHMLVSSKKSLINGLSKLTVGFRVKPRSDLAVTGTARTLFYVSRSTNSNNIRAAVTLSGGTTGRRAFSDFGVADSATAGDSRTTTAASGPQLANDAFGTLIVEYDLSTSPCTCSFFTTSASTADYVDSGLVPVTGSAPFAFGASDSIVICLGDVGGGTARPSLCEIAAVAVIADAGNATLRANLKSYLDAAA